MTIALKFAGLLNYKRVGKVNEFYVQKPAWTMCMTPLIPAAEQTYAFFPHLILDQTPFRPKCCLIVVNSITHPT